MVGRHRRGSVREDIRMGPKGFCGVQVSPPNEHTVITQRRRSAMVGAVSTRQLQAGEQVWRRGSVQGYGGQVQESRSQDLRGRRFEPYGCGRSGTGQPVAISTQTAGSFPGVPFGPNDFHKRSDCPSASGNVDNYRDPKNVRNCNLVGLVGINGGTDYVRGKQAEFLNHLIDIGVAGFRCDASKHIYPARTWAVKDLPEGFRPFFYHEVSDFNNEAVHDSEYFGEGYVTEFRYSSESKERRGQPRSNLLCLRSGLEHESIQPGLCDGSLLHKRAQAFTLAYNYGFTRVMSSYYFDNKDQGPPHNGDLSTKDVTINPDGSCGNGWVLSTATRFSDEFFTPCNFVRWKPISSMAKFTNFVMSTDSVANWNTANGVLSFNRGNLGFFPMGLNNFNEHRQTGMPSGSYCDLISDCKVKVNVDGSGNAQISPADGNDPFVAIISQHGASTTRSSSDLLAKKDLVMVKGKLETFPKKLSS
ncbi:hypothetical protein RRG08_020067 [Elysia crispata]|uniref:alpha-amylase n=1 Tax=Elysia crispata TaxID=231223 RepID=A0AAE1CYY2_9GAST|nr:hypothetical protein RRG08_020067 [Elysia crispata]